MKKLLTIASLALMCNGAMAQNVTRAYTDDEFYKKALWMTTRFYGSERSGEGPNWLTAKHTVGSYNGTSYLKDADGDYDLTGGWFDCGDFVKFGQTQYYSCYMLLLGYSEFPKGYRDYYSADYSGYLAADDYTYESAKGKPNGIPDILDECKYATDYFMKCMRSKDQFYYQVGVGSQDHQHWSTSVYKSAMLSKSQGGESDGSRPVFSVSSGATSMVALCGASLAAMYRLYKDFNSTYANQCLAKGNHGNIGSANGTEYPSKPRFEPDLVIYYCEMYRATNDASWKTKAESAYSQMGSSTHGYTICYNNTEDLAEYLMWAACGNTTAKSRLKTYADSYCSSKYMLDSKGDGTWGPVRYSMNQAFVRALNAKATGNLTTIDDYVMRQTDWVLGANDAGLSLVVGVGKNFAQYPHSRNYYLNDNNNIGACKPIAKYSQYGYMQGGQRGSLKNYTNDPSKHEQTEGGIDYNAGMVGTLGYICSIIAPKTSESETAKSYTVSNEIDKNYKFDFAVTDPIDPGDGGSTGGSGSAIYCGPTSSYQDKISNYTSASKNVSGQNITIQSNGKQYCKLVVKSSSNKTSNFSFGWSTDGGVNWDNSKKLDGKASDNSGSITYIFDFGGANAVTIAVWYCGYGSEEYGWSVSSAEVFDLPDGQKPIDPSVDPDDPSTGIDDPVIPEELKLYSYNKTIYCNKKIQKIVNLSGCNQTFQNGNLCTGIYIVIIDNKAYKVFVK